LQPYRSTRVNNADNFYTVFGEPYEDVYKTLSHCFMYSITFLQFMGVIADDEELVECLREEKQKSKADFDPLIQLRERPNRTELDAAVQPDV